MTVRLRCHPLEFHIVTESLKPRNDLPRKSDGFRGIFVGGAQIIQAFQDVDVRGVNRSAMRVAVDGEELVSEDANVRDQK